MDTCVWGGAKSELLRAGHDVVWAGDWATDPGDLEILELARREQRTLVTLDKDFGELAVLRGLPHCGIVRLVGLRAREQAPMLIAALVLHGPELSQGGDGHGGTRAAAFQAGTGVTDQMSARDCRPARLRLFSGGHNQPP